MASLKRYAYRALISHFIIWTQRQKSTEKLENFNAILPKGNSHSSESVFTVTSLPVTSSYSGLWRPMRYLSNHPTICCRRSIRCQGWPERESSCDSPGNLTITVGRLRNLSARNISSPPDSGGVR